MKLFYTAGKIHRFADIPERFFDVCFFSLPPRYRRNCFYLQDLLHLQPLKIVAVMPLHFQCLLLLVGREHFSVCSTQRQKLFCCLEPELISCQQIFISISYVFTGFWTHYCLTIDTSKVFLPKKSFVVFFFPTGTSNNRTRVKAIQSDRAV